MRADIIILILFIILISSVIQAAFGFGFSLVVMAVLPMFMSMNRAVIFNLMLALICNVIMSVRFRDKICWKELIPMLVPTVIICSVTAVWAVGIDASLMYFLLGLMLVFSASYFFIFSDRIHIKATVRSGIFLGLICGVLGGLFSLAGPVAALYLLPALEDKEKFVATTQMFFLGMNLVNLITRIIMGTLEMQDVPALGLGSIMMLLGIFIGLKLQSKVKGEWFKRVVYGIVGLNGLWIVISHFPLH